MSRRSKLQSNTGQTNKTNEKIKTTLNDSVQFLLKGVSIKCRNKKQKEFITTVDQNEITICVGDSGVGKSYISLIKGLEMLKEGKYKKMFIITPLVETEESIGYLKGSLADKAEPYLYSIYYIIDKIIGEENRKKLVEKNIIETLCLSFLRGCNLDDCVLIADESQNISKKGIITLLTRIGYNACFLISGDLNQIDKFKNSDDSGLKYAYDRLQGVKNIGFVKFEKTDIVRNPIISDILEKLNNPAD